MTRMTKIISTVTIVLFAIGFFSCSNMQDNGAVAVPFGAATTDDNAAYLTLTLDDASVSKTLLPDVQGAVFSNLVLKGTKQGESQKTLGSWASAAAMQSASVPLEVGIWTFNLSATSGGSSFSGTLQKEIVSGQNQLLFSLALDDIGGGPGSFSLALSFDGAANAQNVSRVVASLENMDKTIVSGYEPKNLAISNNAVTFSGSQITAGTYRAKIKFYASVNEVDTEIASWSELVQIASGFDSSASRTIESFDELYTINYELNGGSFAAGTVVPETFTRRSNVTLPLVIAPDYYDFSGWYVDENFSVGNEISMIERMPNDIVVYAKFKPHIYYITYFIDDDRAVETYTVEDNVTLMMPSDDEVVLIGWYKDNSLSGEVVTGWVAGEKHDDVTFYADYTLNITLNDDSKLEKIKKARRSAIITLTNSFKSFEKLYKVLYENAYDSNHLWTGYYDNIKFSYDLSNIEWGKEFPGNKDWFSRCVESIIIPNGVECIGTGAVCSDTKSVIMPDTVVKIDESAFSDCASLENIVFSRELKIIDKYAFERCTSLKSLIMPTSCETIGYGAFQESGLESVVIPGECSIGEWAFYKCKSLKSVKILKGDKVNICRYAFGRCSNLETFEWEEGNSPQYSPQSFPYGGCKIAYGAFFDSSSLKSLFIPSYIYRIERNAFPSSITQVEFQDTVSVWYWDKDSGTFTDENYLYQGPMSVDAAKNANLLNTMSFPYLIIKTW